MFKIGFVVTYFALLGACSNSNPTPQVAEKKPPKLIPKSAIQECAYIEDFLEMRRCEVAYNNRYYTCLLYTSPSPRDVEESRMPSSA